jgi:hypothetical protein
MCSPDIEFGGGILANILPSAAIQNGNRQVLPLNARNI